MEEEKKAGLAMILVLCTIVVMVLVLFIVIIKSTTVNKTEVENIVIDKTPENTIDNTTESEKEEYNNMTEDSSEFLTAFLKLENNKNNLIYSPLSIKYALEMLNEGAGGNTKKQIEDAIGNLKLGKYQGIEKVLSLANAVYIREEFSSEIKKDYIDILSQKYDAEVKYDSFSSADNINSWIEEKTFEKIKNMLSDEQVTNPFNRMILVNALAIDMEWKEKFRSNDTYGEPFYKEDGTEIEATTMSNNFKGDNTSFYKDDDVTVLAMDLKEYNDRAFEFITIMPEDNLSEYLDSFSEDKLKSITDNLTLASKTKKGINVLIPKFAYNYSLNLKNDLISLGISDAFNAQTADFSNMTDKEGYYVGEALHKADIEFSEDGVKAAAATVIMMEMNAMFTMDDEKPIDITIDKPFLYVIRDKNTKEIWFLGTVYEPNLWKNDKAEYGYDM